MRNINVWAYHRGDFGTLCRYPKLDEATGLSYPRGNQQGQPGWDVAIPFKTLHELAERLGAGVPMPRQFCGNYFSDCAPIRHGEVVRLAIQAHGNQGGKVYVNGAPPRLLQSDPAWEARVGVLTPDRVRFYHDDLHKIGLYTRESGSTILFASCVAGQGAEGARLLKELSRVWPGRRVVGFSTLGYRHPGVMKRTGEACEAPGVRDTEEYPVDYQGSPQRTLEKLDRLWKDLEKMPWAWEGSPHAKVVLNGQVIRCPVDEPLAAVCNG